MGAGGLQSFSCKIIVAFSRVVIMEVLSAWTEEVFGGKNL